VSVFEVHQEQGLLHELARDLVRTGLKRVEMGDGAPLANSIALTDAMFLSTKPAQGFTRNDDA